MNDRILVTYATCTGSTAGVAEAIGKFLTEGGVGGNHRLQDGGMPLSVCVQGLAVVYGLIGGAK